jgi:hypothetical protein
MPDFIEVAMTEVTDGKLGSIITKLWSDYVRGLIMLEEFNSEVFVEMLKARGDR